MPALIEKIKSISLFKRCVLCNSRNQDEHAICKACFQRLPKLNHPCLGCALPLLGESVPYCKVCLKTPPIIDELNINYPFIEPLRTLIHRYKFYHGLYLTSFLGALMLQRTHLSMPALLIPIPLHPQRLKERGFNQSMLLTNYLSKRLNIPFAKHDCKKIIHTPPQVSLSAELRNKNHRDSFEIIDRLYPEHIALVDDVYTTGATVNALTQLFKEKGVKRVDVWCVARTILAPTEK